MPPPDENTYVVNVRVFYKGEVVVEGSTPFQCEVPPKHFYVQYAIDALSKLLARMTMTQKMMAPSEDGPLSR